VRVPGHRDHAVVLTKDGRSLLERHRDRDQEHGQTFYAGLKREREVDHDLQVYRAYERAEERLLELRRDSEQRHMVLKEGPERLRPHLGGQVDCLSFVVMEKLGIREALDSDFTHRFIARPDPKRG
jgi:predicted nucleic acid-binding protein